MTNMPPPYQIKVFEAEDRAETVTKILIPKVLSPTTTLRAIPVDRTKYIGETRPSTSPQPPYVIQRGATLRPSQTVPECPVGYSGEIAAIVMAVIWILSFCCLSIKLTRNINNFTGCNCWFLFPCSGHPSEKEDTGIGMQELGKVFKKNF